MPKILVEFKTFKIIKPTDDLNEKITPEYRFVFNRVLMDERLSELNISLEEPPSAMCNPFSA